MRPSPARKRPVPGGVGACVWLVAVVAAVWFPSPAGAARAAVLEQVRLWTAPDHTRIVLDLSAHARYEVRSVTDPDRIAINVAGARFAESAPIVVEDGVVRRIRRNALRGRAQVVLDLAGPSSFRHFALPSADGRPERIVIDVFRPGSTTSAASEVAGAEAGTPDLPEAPASTAATPASPEAMPPAAAPALPERAVPFTVIVDPGHGGMDPGAMRGGLREKDITLAVGLELARRIDALPGWRAVLTRRGDYFVSLAERVRIARRERGDVFVSLHCNTHPKERTAGMEVYFLSLQGATDREAQELADKENAADLVGLAPDEAQDDSVLSILMDLRMARVLDQSSRLAEEMIGAARRSGFLGARRVKQARFQVLRSLAMPSALVELAYLSNARDRALLGDERGRRRLAELLVDGLAAYRGEAVVALGPAAQGNAASGSAVPSWERRYRVRRGDTLWKLARDHGTTIAEICERNALKTPEIRIGQRLRLPGDE